MPLLRASPGTSQEAGQLYFGSENFSGAVKSFAEPPEAANRQFGRAAAEVGWTRFLRYFSGDEGGSSAYLKKQRVDWAHPGAHIR